MSTNYQPPGVPDNRPSGDVGRTPERVETSSTETSRVQTGGVGTSNDAGATSAAEKASNLGLDRSAVVDREKERYGGIKVGSAFFGWLTATGTAVLLTALLTAAGAAVGIAKNTDPGKAASDVASNASAVGITGGIILLVILFVAYYCGGYVAGRMARFNGARQGMAVWVWAVVIAVVVAILAAVAGSKYDVLSNLNSSPRIPISMGDLTTGGIIALLAAAAASLIGAILGGLAGMRFHRNVDKAGLSH